MKITQDTNFVNQVQIYSIGSDSFYTHEEQLIQNKLEDYYSLKRVEDEIEEKELTGDTERSQRRLDYRQYLTNKVEEYGQSVRELKDELQELIIANEDVRELDPSSLTHNNLISLFESSFTRTLKMPVNKTSESIIIIRAYYYEMLNDLIKDGFVNNKGERYIYFSSSAGQIRQKKAVFVKESLWNKYSNTLMCGLTVDHVNKNGGMSVNKLLSYKALSFSASDKWNGFDIDRVVVVDDVMSNLKDRIVDFIDRDNYDVTRKAMNIELEITDGAGMCLPNISDKSFQFRMPWCKGLISPVPFDEFVKETDGASSKIKDIYGDTWDIVDDNIQLILFKSQFKMSKYYDSWDDYKQKFKGYNCEASFFNVEKDIIPDAKLGYQYLQQLVDITDEELTELAKDTNDQIASVGRCKSTMLEIMGADETNEAKNSFQKALEMYPALLNDVHAKQAIKDKKRSMVKEGRAGKLNVNGKYTYILPDWIAVMENVFMSIENPTGALADGEVLCRLYDEGKVDLMRSPALSFEHAVRNNVTLDKKMKKYFDTDAIYISGQDLLPKILQADFDGDTILVSPDKTLISVVERNHKAMDIVPLEYEMGDADPQQVNNDSIYHSLTIAFNANIGEVSNTISKVWNSDEPNLRVIKQLSAYNNYVIDMAKTLDLPEPKEETKAIWNEYSNHTNLLPHFFRYAKGKKKKQVAARNDSTVNRLMRIVENKRIHFADVAGVFDHTKLMNHKGTRKWITSGEIDKAIVELYDALNQRKHSKMNHRELAKDRNNKKGKLPVHRMIRNRLLEVHSNATEVADVLVRHLYVDRDSKAKTTLWESFGKEIIRSMDDKIKCEDCGDVVEKTKQRQVRCDDCQKEDRRRKDAERKRIARMSA